MRSIKALLTSRLGRVVTILAVMPGVVFFYLKFGGHLNPGPVSASQRHGRELGGYSSHAEFEQECKHCHAPVHCITASRCQKCHIDVAQQRISGEGLHARLPATERCQVCHKEHQGREAAISDVPLTNVDHAALTGFSLVHHAYAVDGTPMGCEDCHTEQIFAASNVSCEGCHTDEAEDALIGHKERFGGDCLLCHDGHDRMVPFTHANGLPLEGAHAEADCEACHQERVFVGLTQECVACHEEPDYHRGQFGDTCERCHTVMAWAPAQLRFHIFRLDHAIQDNAVEDGGQDDLACETCHTETYTEHTCYGCHDHDPAELLAAHDAADVTDVTQCVECHPTGESEELAGLQSPGTGSGVPAQMIDAPQGRP